MADNNTVRLYNTILSRDREPQHTNNHLTVAMVDMAINSQLMAAMAATVDMATNSQLMAAMEATAATIQEHKHFNHENQCFSRSTPYLYAFRP